MGQTLTEILKTPALNQLSLNIYVLVTQSSPTLSEAVALSLRFSGRVHWRGLPFPSPEIFLTQGLKTGLWHCRSIIYHLSSLGSPSFNIIST